MHIWFTGTCGICELELAERTQGVGTETNGRYFKCVRDIKVSLNY